MSGVIHLSGDGFRNLLAVASLFMWPAVAMADKYGLDESAEEGSASSWGAVLLVVAVLLWLHFRRK